MGMRSIRGPRWMLQLYWPSLWFRNGIYGVKLDTAVLFSRYNDGGWSSGFNVLGFGLGIARFPTRIDGVPDTKEADRG